MCGHSGDFHGKGAGRGHGWVFLKHEERVARLVHAKEDLETQLAEI